MKFSKVVYFDEGSAADYMQIIAGGNMKKTTELISDVSSDANTSFSGDVGVSTKGLSALFKVLGGVKVEADISGQAGIEAKNEKIAKTILENTLLADFVDMIDGDKTKKKNSNNGDNSICQFENLELYPLQNSFTYMMLMAPFFTMIDGEVPISSDNGKSFKLDISKIETAISRGRGYYEFVSGCEGEEKVFRFSSTAFRNNYTLSDIPKMQLSVYAVKVGYTDKNKMDLTSEFQFGTKRKDRKEYGDDASDVRNQSLEVYDVIVAGIRS